ncbi:MAG: isocitrate/isopropylmalate dehydrogenase family protein [Myxococcota bacterium]
MEREKRIAIIPGDGVGKEVVAQGRRLLEVLRQHHGCRIQWEIHDLGADRFLQDGTSFPVEVADRIRTETDAVLLGALGDPRVPDMQYARDILFGLRFGLDLYCNVRPIVCLADRLMPLRGRKANDCDITVFRENTEGIYVGVGGHFKKGTPDEIAINEDINTRKGVERIIRAAFEHAVQNKKHTVHMADKSNAMKHAHELWRRCFFEVAEEYEGTAAKHVYVDALCLYLIQDPSQFEVIVTCNLFGDIVTDLGAALQGGMGMAASANVHPGRVSMFEPVHGSAPDIAGQDKANPIATFLTVGMMMTHLGFEGVEDKIVQTARRAVEGGYCTLDVGGDLGTTAVGDWFCSELSS